MELQERFLKYVGFDTQSDPESEPYPEVINKAIQAMKDAGVVPLVRPIRSGTNGARLSDMGLPCPNLFTGGMNFHGKYEYRSVNTMKKSMQTILNPIGLWAN